MQQVEEIVSTLHEGGLRITPQRIAIVEYLLKTDEHPSAEHIHKVIQKQYPMVSRSTVYKTLELLKNEKLVNEIEVGHESRYDAHTEDHLNLVCLKCGKIEDLDDDSLKEIQTKASRKSKYRILKGVYELFGYCENCKTKEN